MMLGTCGYDKEKISALTDGCLQVCISSDLEMLRGAASDDHAPHMCYHAVGTLCKQ